LDNVEYHLKIMVNRLTQIYTKTGDEGKTGLGDGLAQKNLVFVSNV